MSGSEYHGDPHRDADHWEALIERIGPASMLVAIAAEMSEWLKARMTPEDIWQETLLHAWRDRDKHQWRDVKSYRAWVRQIARNRILDADKFHRAKARFGHRAEEERLSSASGELPANSKSVGSIVWHAERARLMTRVLSDLPEELRVVIQLRLIDDLTMQEVAQKLGIPTSTAWYRYRKAAEEYAVRFRELGGLSSLDLSPQRPPGE